MTLLGANSIYMKLSFFGAAGEVTGSLYLLEVKDKKIVIDCGIFQGSKFADEKNLEPFEFDPTEIDAVVVTHAHADHNARIPKLVHEGYRGPVYTTEVSAKLVPIVWYDAAKIMAYDHKKTGDERLYTDVDVKRAEERLKGVKYGKTIDITDEIKITFHDAGHILGSAWVEITNGDFSYVFSGDLGNVDVPIVREKEPYPGSDVLIMESTYGDRTHGPGTDRAQKLKEILIDTVEAGGVLMIPAFSLERTQEILYELNYLIDECKCIPKVPIFLDSPMAIRATNVYNESTDVMDKAAREKVGAGDALFDFPGLKMTLSTDESKAINDIPNPKVIIAGSGMMAGGRIMHHLKRYLKDPKSTLLIVSYQAQGTLGSKIQGGAKSVSIYGEKIDIKCNIEQIGAYSAHADADMLVDWVKQATKKPRHIYLTHGDPESAEALAERLRRELGCDVRIPKRGDVAELQ